METIIKSRAISGKINVRLSEDEKEFFHKACGVLHKITHPIVEGKGFEIKNISVHTIDTNDISCDISLRAIQEVCDILDEIGYSTYLEGEFLLEEDIQNEG